jgi:predicted dehydrogenase
MVETKGAEVSVVCDLEASKLESIRTRYPAIRTTTEYRELLEDDRVDAIVVTTPVSTHFPLAASTSSLRSLSRRA